MPAKGRFPLALSLALGALAVVGPAPARAEPRPVPKVAFERRVLPNGLVAIVHEDRTSPLVVVDVSYRVGSRFERAGRTGFAHLFEHLMFMGTRRVPTKAFDAWMEEVGGWNNAWTSQDRTAYFDVAPPPALDLLLWLEADRMADLGPFMTREKLDAQREVVRNERRQNSENRPYGRAHLRLPELLWPASHPYHHPVIGSHEDLEAASVDDVKGFFAEHYRPSNAVVVVAGDVGRDAAFASIGRTFGALAGGARPADPGLGGLAPADVALRREVKETLTDDVELARTEIAWQTPPHFAKGDAELDLLASVLSNGKGSRLYKALVIDKKLAQSVDASQVSGHLGSHFSVSAMARPGVSLDALEAALDAELEAVRTKPVSAAELERAKNGFEASFWGRLESARGRASLLGGYEAELGDAGAIARDVARYRDATAEGVREVAATRLPKGARVVLRVVPRPRPPAAAPPPKATPAGGAK